MTTKDDWEFRADHLEDHATFLEDKTEEIKQEAARYRGLAEQARYLARCGDHEGWQTIDSAPRNEPVQVWAADKSHHWLPFTAWREHSRWMRPATSDPLPFTPTHWRRLPNPPRAAPDLSQVSQQGRLIWK